MPSNWKLGLGQAGNTNCILHLRLTPTNGASFTSRAIGCSLPVLHSDRTRDGTPIGPLPPVPALNNANNCAKLLSCTMKHLPGKEQALLPENKPYTLPGCIGLFQVLFSGSIVSIDEVVAALNGVNWRVNGIVKESRYSPSPAQIPPLLSSSLDLSFFSILC